VDGPEARPRGCGLRMGAVAPPHWESGSYAQKKNFSTKIVCEIAYFLQF